MFCHKVSPAIEPESFGCGVASCFDESDGTDAKICNKEEGTNLRLNSFTTFDLDGKSLWNDFVDLFPLDPKLR